MIFFKTLWKQRRWILLGGIIIFGWLAYYTATHSTSTTDSIYSGTEITVSTWDIIQALTLNGTTAFADTQKLTFNQWGKVTNVYVKVGDSVKKDQVLATVESSDIDLQLTQAKISLENTTTNYEKQISNQNRELAYIKAQSTLQTAESNLANIETTIGVQNADEDAKIQAAQNNYDDALQEYQELLASSNEDANADASVLSNTTRTKNNTYQSAIEYLDNAYYATQNTLDDLDRIMYFTNKYVVQGSTERSIYIGAKTLNGVSKTEQAFLQANQDNELLKSKHTTLASLPIGSVTESQIKDAYNTLENLGRDLQNLWSSARDMFDGSITDSSLTQSMINNYINQATNIYNNWKTYKDKATSTMESIYNLDDANDLTTSKQKVDSLKVTLDNLLLSKNKREATNQATRVAAQSAVIDAQQAISNLDNGYDTIDVQNAKNSVIQAQANVDNVQKKYDNYRIKANFNWVVTEMNLQKWDNISLSSSTTDQKYIYVESADLVEIALTVDQTDILKLTNGMSAEVTLDVYPNDVISGVVSEISTIPITSTSSQSTYTIKVSFQKPSTGNIQILGGMSASVKIVTSEKRWCIIIPATAVTKEGNNSYVTLPNGTKKQIEVGDTDSSNIEVTNWLTLWQKILSLSISSNELKKAWITSWSSNSTMQWMWGGPMWWGMWGGAMPTDRWPMQ